MYEIKFTPDAAEDLRALRTSEQVEIMDGIYDNLQYEPTVETHNQFRMRENYVAEWGLRLGKFRVFYIP
jgi:mRNA-degrading endonuclease RelE of RelBE toxin-antitoxin system